ncbi:UDP-N-acetylmuramoyl-tripeptide--D-alanyl-D-alanine ligase [Anaerocolumna sp. AGMB13025]|uniref:UDP-N-acetylmuramoyl-tripeptide--D-alanyl-D- alanine ligase n=1 Tax=Anaerocolumna sp. AGMB13025 TaxID=3039116 RepID=UPI00241DF10F|nr:UDP-N-acetylmuramoyl-tripeptide--D-alanyl-D-alanine ligase [Anaerocolumna sp. AGMB13025]WFR55018.1 UDP-N-acetylmuramoyl-tripeptide--D-alanyl-D-alanine ligase [Anaerocolumna sp. AGMB13025]
MEALSVKEIACAVGGRILCGDENTLITSVGTNSKNMEPDSLFVPIVGERVDAHDFIEDAFRSGAAACFTSREGTENKYKVYIKVTDTLKALQALGTYYRNRYTLPVVGITGSVGKTTTKEMIAAALSTKYNVLKTEGNMNSQVGLPLMMLRMEPRHEIAVIEMGMSEEGEMAKLADIAKPETAVMTNIGVSHIAQLKTRENIRKEKLNIINSFGKDSVLFINGDDDLLGELNTLDRNSDTLDLGDKTRDKYAETSVISFGISEFCNYRAEDIKTIDGETHFILQKNSGINTNGNEGTESEEIVLKVLGMHNVLNALSALAVAEHYDIPVRVAKKGLYEYRPIAMRGQIKEVNQIKLIDDSYNASPDSMKSGIQVLLELAGVKRRIAVLADVLELGELSAQCHYEVGLYISDQKIDEVLTVGSEAFHIAKAIQDKKAPVLTRSFMNNQEAIEYLLNHIKPGDGILVKGSRGMKTDEIVKAVCEA